MCARKSWKPTPRWRGDRIFDERLAIRLHSIESSRAHGAVYPAVGSARLRGRHGSVTVLLGTPRTDQGVSLTIRIIEQVGEDGRGEARVVELEGEIVAALLRLLRPGSPDLSTPDEDPVAGDIVGGLTGL
jgi:hypothetical protein